MFRHFFAKARLRAHLLLTLATHQPIVPLLLLHLVAVAAVWLGRAPADLRWDLVAPFLLVLWLPVLGWEICRKIRAPEQETDYVTYSRLLGVRGSVAFAVVVQAFAAGAAAHLWSALALTPAYLAVLAVSFAVVLWSHVRFLWRPVAANAVAKRYAQAYLVVLAALQILEFGVLS